MLKPTNSRGYVTYLVLILLVFLGFAFTLILRSTYWQRSYIAGQMAQLKASALAHSGIALSKSLLSKPHATGKDSLEITPSATSHLSLHVQNRGGYALARSVATYGSRKVRVEAVLGERLGPAFRPALSLGNPKNLTLARGARIRGDVALPRPFVVKKSDRKGMGSSIAVPFRGRILPLAKNRLSFARTAALDSQLVHFHARLNSRTPEFSEANQEFGIADTADLAKFLRMVKSRGYWDGSLRISSPNPKMKIDFQGIPLDLRGRLHITDRSFVAGLFVFVGNGIMINDSASVHTSALYSLDEIVMSGQASCNSSLISNWGTTIQHNANITYPGFLFVSSARTRRLAGHTQAIRILDWSRVTGTIATSRFNTDYERKIHRSRIKIGPKVRIAGIIATPLPIQPDGRISGSVWAYECSFFQKNIVFINWMVAGLIKGANLDGFIAPPLFQAQPVICPLTLTEEVL